MIYSVTETQVDIVTPKEKDSKRNIKITKEIENEHRWRRRQLKK